MDVAVDCFSSVHSYSGRARHTQGGAVRKRRDKEVYRIHLILVSGMKSHRLADSIHLTYNSGLVRDVIREIILINVFRVVVAKLRVVNRCAAFILSLCSYHNSLSVTPGFFNSL